MWGDGVGRGCGERRRGELRGWGEREGRVERRRTEIRKRRKDREKEERE